MSDFHEDSKIEPLVFTLQVRNNALLGVAATYDVHLPSGETHRRARPLLEISAGLQERLETLTQELIGAVQFREGLTIREPASEAPPDAV